MNVLKENTLTIVLALLCAVYFGYYLSVMNWTSGGGDTYTHFLFAKYAFQHPENFVNHWGKPFFTLFAAPFSQLGLKGVEAMNIGCGILSGVFAALTARSLGYKFHFLAVVFTVFAPVMYNGIFSSLTEPVAALVLIAGVYFYSIKNFKLGSIIFSFLILCRTEIFIFYPLFIFFLWGSKSLKSAPYLALGFVLYSFIGWPFYEDLFWIITKQPYADASAKYGSGGFWHYAESYDQVIHQLLSVLLLISLIRFPFDVISKRKQITDALKLELLVLSLIMSFFFAHSLVWWMGAGASAGLVRVMMVIVPLIALFSLKALQWEKVFGNKWVQGVFSVAAIAVMVGVAEHKYNFPVNEDLEILTIRKLDKAAIDEARAGNDLFYYHPFAAIQLDANPNDTLEKRFYFNGGFKSISDVKPGDIYLWDSHFAASEGDVSIALIDSLGFQLIQEHESSWKDYSYQVKAFRKL